jgi:hypothetical protein
MFGARPVDASCDSDVIHRIAVVEADDGLETISLSVGARLADPSAEPAGERRGRTVVQELDSLVRAPATGSVQNVRSSSPRSIISRSSLSSWRLAETTSTCGWLSENAAAGAG